jgi:hypothetical protein
LAGRCPIVADSRSKATRQVIVRREGTLKLGVALLVLSMTLAACVTPSAAVPAPAPTAARAADPVAVPAPAPVAARAADPVAVPAPAPVAARAADPVAVPAPDPTAARAGDPVVVPAPAPVAAPAGHLAAAPVPAAVPQRVRDTIACTVIVSFAQSGVQGPPGAALLQRISRARRIELMYVRSLTPALHLLVLRSADPDDPDCQRALARLRLDPRVRSADIDERRQPQQ